MSQADVLTALKEIGRPATASEVVDHLRITRPGISSTTTKIYIHLRKLERSNDARPVGKAPSRGGKPASLWEAR